MKPVKQTKFGAPDGNCFAACIASVLEVPLDTVPHIFGPGEESRWGELDAWLAETGHAFMEWPIFSEMREFQDGIHAIIAGPAPRGHAHSIVARSSGGVWEYVHDPHPSDDFLCGDPTDIAFIVRR